MNVNEKLIKVRELMAKQHVDALLVLTEDPHGSEYPANYWKFREFLSGFNGSAGTLLVTKNHACLWVDSRYYIQGEKQTRDTSIELFKSGMPNVPDYATYITNVMASGTTLGVDGSTINIDTYRSLHKKLSGFGIKINYKVDIVDDMFAPREPLPSDEVLEMSVEIAGMTRMQKIEKLRAQMLKNNITFYIATALDDIAWITNLRGSDVEYNPVFYAYMTVTPNDVNLYIAPHKLSASVSKQLEEEGIKVSLYGHFEDNLKNIAHSSRVFFDPKTTNVRVVGAIPSECVKVEAQSYITLMKSVKSEIEIAHMKQCHIRDGVALVQFYHWLDDHIGKRRITELDVANRLIEYRKMQKWYIGESFEPIASCGSNGAIVHYSPTIESNTELKPEGFLLFDTGAQYLDGTTDITRTFTLGPLTQEAKIDYTLVLKGHIALATAVFPVGTRGVHLDTFARMHMWQHGINYGHGTGHGVGYCLNVHEMPQRIGQQDNGAEIVEGMVTTDEPGIYREGKHGVRTENVTVCVKAKQTEFGDFLKFETITMCPIDTRPIIADMLTTDEIDWLNNYHATVRSTLMPLLTDESDKKWLEKSTQPIK